MAKNDNLSLPKNIIAGIVMAIGLFSATVILGNSWIKILVIALITVSSFVWWISHSIRKKVFEYLIFAVMIFAIIFTASEAYLLTNAGHPPTFNPSQEGVTISYSNILNASLTQIVQSVKTSPTFNLISLEYPGTIMLESMKLDTAFPGGRIEVVLYQESNDLAFMFVCSDGYPYHASISTVGGDPFSQIFTQEEPPEESLNKIDTLGLDWFYNSAVETYHNKTGVNPDINALEISIQWEKYGTYQGMTLQLTGIKLDNYSGSGVFFADFQPNGTLLYLNVAS
jgi:hypothetical protein